MKYLSNRLGYSFGREIVEKFLPTLETDSNLSKHVYSVSPEEKDKLKKLLDSWFYLDDEHEDKEEAFEKYKDYTNKLIKRYLPKDVVTHFPYIDVSKVDLSELRKGINKALKESDISRYKVKKQTWIKSDNSNTSVFITVTLDID